MTHRELSEMSWEELAYRWGRQLSEVTRALHATFGENGMNLMRAGVDAPSDIVITLAMKERSNTPIHERKV